MSKILELREKRAKAWEAAKAFLDAKRHRKVCCPLRMQPPMTRWKMMS